MRISDWSSDVCSSDLNGEGQSRGPENRDLQHQRHQGTPAAPDRMARGNPARHRLSAGTEIERRDDPDRRDRGRSEEHTSELQSLMRISYAVFCLKKKTRKTHSTTTKSRTAHTKTT